MIVSFTCHGIDHEAMKLKDFSKHHLFRDEDCECSIFKQYCLIYPDFLVNVVFERGTSNGQLAVQEVQHLQPRGLDNDN